MKLLQLIVILAFTLLISYAISLPIFYFMNIELTKDLFLSNYIVLVLFNLSILYVGKLKKRGK